MSAICYSGRAVAVICLSSNKVCLFARLVKPIHPVLGLLRMSVLAGARDSCLVPFKSS